MIRPSQTSCVADQIANHSWQLLKTHLHSQFARSIFSEPKTTKAVVTIKNNELVNLITKIHRDLLPFLNQNIHGSVSGAQINQTMANYKYSTMHNVNTLKSIFMGENIFKFVPVLAKLQSLNLNLFKAPEEIFTPQPKVVMSFAFPNAPISSEYFKFFELFHKNNLPSLKKKSPNKKKQKHSNRERGSY